MTSREKRKSLLGTILSKIALRRPFIKVKKIKTDDLILLAYKTKSPAVKLTRIK